MGAKYDLDYLVYAACDGRMGDKEEVEQRYTRFDLMRWLCLRKFDGAE